MKFIQKVSLQKSGDRLIVTIRQKYHPRGQAAKYRWRFAGIFSLEELKKAEKLS